MPLTGFSIEHAPGTSSLDQSRMDALVDALRISPRTSPDLEEELEIPGPKLRALVNALRRAGAPIASSGKGYWLAQNPEDLNDTIAHIGERINSMQGVLKGLAKAQTATKPEKVEQGDMMADLLPPLVTR